jgi:hypothetical protein
MLHTFKSREWFNHSAAEHISQNVLHFLKHCVILNYPTEYMCSIFLFQSRLPKNVLEWHSGSHKSKLQWQTIVCDCETHLNSKGNNFNYCCKTMCRVIVLTNYALITMQLQCLFFTSNYLYDRILPASLMRKQCNKLWNGLQNG